MRVIKFYADWCGPCKVVAPIVEASTKERKVELVDVDVDENPEMMAKYQIRSVPTIVIERGGEEVTRMSGTFTKMKFDAELDGLASR